MIELGIQNDPCWMLDVYMASTSRFVQNDQILSTFQQRVKDQIGRGIEIGWVVGADNFSPPSLEDGMHLICVENRSIESSKAFTQRKESFSGERIHFVQGDLL